MKEMVLFYGPKIDIILVDCIKRPHQCATIQLDFQGPIRFDLSYKMNVEKEKDNDEQDSKSEKKDDILLEFEPDEYDENPFKWVIHNVKPGYERPVIIHRAILGSIERFYSILCEHIKGKWPFWLSPRQIIILSVSEEHIEYAQKVNMILRYNGFHSDVDSSNLSIRKKVKKSQLAQWNYMLVVGQEEIDSKMVDIRSRNSERLGKKSISDLVSMLKSESLDEILKDMLKLDI
jgi:threonyl-tRNA synthetase